MKQLYTFFMVVLLLSACSSGKNAYESGNYYDAVLKAVNRLRQNPNHNKSQETLRVSYPLAVETLEREASNRLASNQPFKYKQVLNAYQQINTLAEEIQRAPGALAVIPEPVNYSDKIPALKEKAAEESYAAGLTALARQTREDAKQAVYLFQDTRSFIPGYKDVDSKLDEAMFMATLKVVVDQIPVPTAYDLSARFFQDKIEEYLHSNYRANPFVRFYTPQEAESEDLPYVDQYLRLQFDDFVVGETHLVQNTETLSKDSVVVGTVKMQDGSTVKVYNTVKAKLTKFRKEVISNGLFSMQVFDAKNNAVLSHRKFNGEFVWFSEWGNFNGDERALTADEIRICQLGEVPPPPPQDMFIEFTKPIYNQLLPAIDGFYKQY